MSENSHGTLRRLIITRYILFRIFDIYIGSNRLNATYQHKLQNHWTWEGNTPWCNGKEKYQVGSSNQRDILDLSFLGVHNAQCYQEYHLRHHHGILKKVKPGITIGNKVSYTY